MAKLPGALRALENREFRLYASGQMVSLVGTWMQMIAQSWLIYRLTGSAAALGIATFFGQLPVLLLAPLGGILVDRLESRRLLVFTQASALLLALALGTLTLLHWVTLWEVVAAAFLLGLVNAVDNPGRQVMVARAVPREHLMNAIALNSSMFNGARILGPALAGILVGLLGEGWCFMLNAASYVAVIVALLRMRPLPGNEARGEASALGELREGIAFVLKDFPIRRALLLLGFLSLLVTPSSVLMPLFADRILHGGPRALGLLSGASGIGALAGAVALAMRRDVRGLPGWIALAGTVFGIALLAFARSRNLALSAVLLVPVSFGFMVVMASTNTLIQMMVPETFRGRVMSIYTVMFLGTVPLGGLLVGAVSHMFSPPATVAWTGALGLVGVAAFALGLQGFRKACRERILAQRAAADQGLSANPEHFRAKT